MPNPGQIVATIPCPSFPEGMVAFRIIDGYYSMSEDGYNSTSEDGLDFLYLAPVSVTSNLINPVSDFDIQQAFLPNYGINYGLSSDAMTLLNNTFAAHSGTNGQGDGQIFYLAINKSTPTMIPFSFKMSGYRYYMKSPTSVYQDIGPTIASSTNVFYIGPATNDMIQTKYPYFYLAPGNAEAQLRTQAFWDHSGVGGSGDAQVFNVNAYYDESSIVQTDIVVATGTAPPAGTVAFILVNKHYYMSTDGINFKYLGGVALDNGIIYPIPDLLIQQVFPTYGINYGLSTDGIKLLDNTFAAHSGTGGNGDGEIFYVAANSATPKMTFAYFKISDSNYYISLVASGPFSLIGPIVPTYLASLWVAPVTNDKIQLIDGFSTYYLEQSTFDSLLQIQSFAARSGIAAAGDGKAFPLIVYSDPNPVIQTGIVIPTGTTPTAGTAKFMMINNSYYMSIDGVNFSNIGSPLNNFEFVRGDPVLLNNLNVYPPSDRAIQSVFSGYGIHYGLSTDAIIELNNTFNSHAGTDNKGDSIVFEVAVTSETPTIVEVYFKMENGKYYISMYESTGFVELYDIYVKGDISGPYCPTDSQIQTSALFTNYSLPMSYVDVTKRRLDFMSHSDIVLVGDYTVTSGVLFKGDGVVFSEYMYTGKIAVPNTIKIPNGVTPAAGQVAFILTNSNYYMSKDGVNFYSLGAVTEYYSGSKADTSLIYPVTDFAIQSIFPGYGINYGLTTEELLDLSNLFGGHSGATTTLNTDWYMATGGDSEIFYVNVNTQTPTMETVWFQYVDFEYYISKYENSHYSSIGAYMVNSAGMLVKPTESMIQSDELFYNYRFAPGSVESILAYDAFSTAGNFLINLINQAGPFSCHLYQDPSIPIINFNTVTIADGSAPAPGNIKFLMQNSNYYISENGTTFTRLGPCYVVSTLILPPNDYSIQKLYPNHSINYGLDSVALNTLGGIFSTHRGTTGEGDGVSFEVAVNTNAPSVVDVWFKISNGRYLMSTDPAVYGYTDIGKIATVTGNILVVAPPTNSMIQTPFINYQLATGLTEAYMQALDFQSNSGAAANGNGVEFFVHMYEGGLPTTPEEVTIQGFTASLTGEASFLIQDSYYYMYSELDENFKWLGPVTTNSNLIYPVSDYLIQQVFPNYGINYELTDVELTGLNSAFTAHSGTDGKGDGISFNVSVNTAVPKVVNAWFKMEKNMYYVSLDSNGDNFVQIGLVAPQYLASVNAKAPSNTQIQSALYDYYAAMGYVENKSISQAFYDRSGLFLDGSLLPSGDGIQFSVHLYSGAIDQVYG